jgi:hypothetical protein
MAETTLTAAHRPDLDHMKAQGNPLEGLGQSFDYC